MSVSVLKYKVRGKVVNIDPLSIGSGKSAIGAIDNPIVRLNNVPYIPGSSLKGVLRAEAERYAKIMGYDVCNVFSNEELERKKNKKEACDVCKVFGGPTIVSAIIVHNLYGKNAVTEIRTSVSISRITGAQSPGRLFDVEFVVPGSEFVSSDGSVVFEVDGRRINLNNKNRHVEILLYVFSRLVNGEIRVGGRKSIGMGRIKLIIDKIEQVTLEDGVLKSEDITQLVNKLLSSVLDRV
ncbi:MAG: type III CRISPR-associated RAMP protein Csx7 [Thermoprotei archaeon]